MPGLLNFDGDSLIVLRHNLLAVSPEEGCALLLGEQKDSQEFQGESLWNIRMVWPCCNIWEPEIFGLRELPKEQSKDPLEDLSRKKRFAIDPLEQIHAQRWARKKNIKVLGTAHSHPFGNAEPSLIDLKWSFCESIMVIITGSGDVSGWWLPKNQPSQRLKMAALKS